MAELGSSPPPAQYDYAPLSQRIKTWGQELGFQQVGIADTDLNLAEGRLGAWAREGRHGEMDYMARHGRRRSRPDQLVPGTIRVISVRMDYDPPGAADPLPQALILTAIVISFGMTAVLVMIGLAAYLEAESDRIDIAADESAPDLEAERAE